MKIIPVMAPFIHISPHIVEAIPIGRITHHRRGIRAEIVSFGPLKHCSCGIEKIFASSIGSNFPFSLRWQTLADPFGVSYRSIPCDANDRMLGIAGLDAELSSAAFDARFAQTDNVIVVYILFTPHRLEKAHELLIGDRMDIDGKTGKLDHVARHLIACTMIASAEIGTR